MNGFFTTKLLDSPQCGRLTLDAVMHILGLLLIRAAERLANRTGYPTRAMLITLVAVYYGVLAIIAAVA